MYIQNKLGYKEVDLGDMVVIDKDIAVWDKMFHVPVASNTFITSYTGIVLSKEYQEAGTKGKAYYRRLYYAMLAFMMVDHLIPNDHDKMMNEAMIAHNEEKQIGLA